MRLNRCALQLAAMTMVSAAATAQSAPRQEVVESYSREQIGAGIYAFIAPEAFGALVSGNSLVVIGDSAVLVVDSGHFPKLTQRMIADIRAITTKPVRYLVNTHWHPDHWLGNGEYRAAFPAVSIISTSFTRDMIREKGPRFLAGYSDSAAMAGQLNGAIASVSSADERAYYQSTLADALPAVRAWRGARVELPDVLVDHTMRVDLGGRVVEIFFAGRGNTSGDLVVFVPKEGVMATGDLVVAPTPYAYESYFGDWVTTLDTLRARSPTIVVPGHGPIERGTAYLDAVRELLRATRDGARRAVKAGKTLDEFRKSFEVASFVTQFGGADARRRYLFDLGFSQPGLRRAFEEATFQVER